MLIVTRKRPGRRRLRIISLKSTLFSLGLWLVLLASFSVAIDEYHDFDTSHFNGDEILDQSGNDAFGRLRGANESLNGLIEQSLTCDGTDFIELNMTGCGGASDANFTVWFWFNSSSASLATASEVLFSKNGGSGFFIQLTRENGATPGVTLAVNGGATIQSGIHDYFTHDDYDFIAVRQYFSEQWDLFVGNRTKLNKYSGVASYSCGVPNAVLCYDGSSYYTQDTDFDEVGIAYEYLNDSYITDTLWNNGDGWTWPDVDSPDLDLLFLNGSGIDKNDFFEGESFQVYLNYTNNANGLGVNDSSCWMTLMNFTEPLSYGWGSDVFFDDSSGLYFLNVSFSFPDHGDRVMWANCSNPNSLLSSNYSEGFHIENLPPVVRIVNVSTSNGTTDLFDGAVVEYSSDDFVFGVDVVDDDLSWVVLNLFNGSDNLIYSFGGNPQNETIIPHDFFVDFSQNPFNLTVWANDTTGNYSYEDVFFNVSDTIYPAWSGFSNVSVQNGTVYHWNAEVVDENLFAFNISCDNGFNFFIDEINNYTYNFVNSTLIDQNVSCWVDVCDGHTGKEISLSVDKISPRALVIGGQAFNYTGAYDVDITSVKKKDRVSFIVSRSEKNLDKKLLTYHFQYRTLKGVYLPSERYQGWIVDYPSRTWFDLNSNEDADVVVYPLSDGVFDIQVKTRADSITFESIGELNCRNFTQEINRTFEGPGVDQAVLRSFTSIPQALFFMFLMALWIVFLLMTVLIKGPNGKTVQLLNILQGVLGIVTGFAWIQFSWLIGIPVLLVSLTFMLSLLVYDSI